MDCAKYLVGCKRYLLLVIISALILTFSFTPAQVNASTGFFISIWCDLTSLLDFTCDTTSEITVANPVSQPEAPTVTGAGHTLNTSEVRPDEKI